MIDPAKIDEVSRRVIEALPASEGLERVREDLTRNLRALLGAALARLELVDREDFEVQREVLARTRARLEELERRVEALERTPPETTADSEPASS